MAYRPALGVEQHLATSVAKDGVPLGSSSVEFPMVCETCLGPNPYVRMIKLRFGDKLCKVSNVPFQGFRWKAGPEGRFKETIICREVALEKNICQACLTDLTYGVPVGVRDALLKRENTEEPKSKANQLYYYQQQREKTEESGASRELLTLARSLQHRSGDSTAFRNLPKLCSFWVGGTCRRHACPFRPCCGAFKFPELAASHPDECRALVEALKEKGPRAVMATCPDSTRKLLKGTGTNADLAIKERAAGKDDLSQRYLGRVAKKTPVETNVVWVGGAASERDLRDALYHVGEIRNARVKASCALVEFEEVQAAHRAVALGSIDLDGKSLPLDYAKNHQEDEILSEPRPLSSGPLRPELAAALEKWGPAAVPPLVEGPPPRKRPRHYPSMDPSRLGTTS
ncbi:hypothetical protein CTAYLR_006923 [Chrysophaeum taylorii]|uniref:RRM domain-containing protein n=1 Tax=Chrysophaeum taylorii TaxID=2483200 RepID=A0AAD7U994_9STRA|nr:hypothetical protein CTAYLR_006923 [Chrysophaeum taylorii]